MKKHSTIYWIGKLVSYLLAFGFIATVITMVLGFPIHNMFSGMAGCAIVICLLLISADEETREFIKKKVG